MPRNDTGQYHVSKASIKGERSLDGGEAGHLGERLGERDGALGPAPADLVDGEAVTQKEAHVKIVMQIGLERRSRALKRGDARRREDLGQLEDGAHVLAAIGEIVAREAAPQKGERTSKP